MVGSGVLSLLDEADARWEDKRHPSHAALKNALDARLSPPAREPSQCTVSRLRFTHNRHSHVFRHGDHAGNTVAWLVDKLLAGRIRPEDPSMVLNVVLFHGEYRSLNNRHAVALVRYAEEVERQSPGSPVTCFIRVWPLVRGLRLDDGSDRDVAKKFLEANDSHTDGTVIVTRSRNGNGSTQTHETVRVHVSNLDFSIGPDELGMHLVAAGLDCPVWVEISRRDDGRSNGFGWITCWSVEAAQRIVNVGIPQLHGRELRVKLDTTSSAATSEPEHSSGGWIRCKSCKTCCASLIDALIVEDVRQARDGTPGVKFNAKRGYFCIADEKRLLNCDLSPHPESDVMSFKLKQVECSSCGSDLGNVQSGTAMEGPWSDLCGARIVNFKCAMVLLELTDCSTMLVEAKKWSALGKALGNQNMYRLSQLTLRHLSQLLSTVLRNSGKDVRLISNSAVP